MWTDRIRPKELPFEEQLAAQKQLFHEFKHARQSEDVLADEAARA